MTIFDEMVEELHPQSPNDRLNAKHEVMQQITLAGLWRGGFFEHAAFYGGTCLRLFHGVRRFFEGVPADFFRALPGALGGIPNGVKVDPFDEIFRAGIQAVPKGQYEAAKTLGMSYPQTMRRIILPQVIRIVLPPVSNETINLVKDTSLIYILAMNDLLRVARTIVQREFDMTPFLIAAVFYLAMTFVLTWGFKKLEARYGKY